MQIDRCQDEGDREKRHLDKKGPTPPKPKRMVPYASAAEVYSAPYMVVLPVSSCELKSGKCLQYQSLMRPPKGPPSPIPSYTEIVSVLLNCCVDLGHPEKRKTYGVENACNPLREPAGLTKRVRIGFQCGGGG